MNPEELLVHSDFVHSLARSLVLDENAAADLSQATWASVLEHPPAAGKSARAWLARVLRNFAVTFHRRETRLRRREHAAAEPEGLPSTEKIVEKMEIRRLLIDAVLKLDEPYRSTIILRFYEGLSLREIASRLDRPLETVRTREKRGLAMLRARLDSLHHGDRNTWCIALAPLAGIELAAPAAKAAVTAQGLLAGVLAMTTKLKALFIAAAALVLIGTAIILWPETQDSGAAIPIDLPLAAEGAETPQPMESAIQDTTGIREPVLPDLDSPAMPATFRKMLGGFRGRVLKAAGGAPVSGVRVEILGFRPNDLFQGMSSRNEEEPTRFAFRTSMTHTVKDGTFFLEGIFPSAIYLLAVDRGGEHPCSRLIDAQPNPGEMHDLGDIMLHQTAVLAGRVMDDQGSPLMGARVRAVQLPALIFSFGVHHVRTGCSLLFEDDPLFSRESVFDIPPAFFDLLDILSIPEAVTVEDGSFRLVGVPAGPVTLLADREGYVSRYKSHVASAAKAEQDAGEMMLTRGVTLKGKVVDAQGRPAEGVEVRAGQSLWNQDWCLLEPPAFTDSQGAFILNGFPSSPARGAIRRNVSDPWILVGPFLPDQEPVFRLPAATDLAVKITNEDKNPVGEACLRIRTKTMQNVLPSQRAVSLEDRIESVSEGLYRITGLAPGRYELLVEAEGYGSKVRGIVLEDRPVEEEIVLKPAAQALIRVLDQKSTRPLEWAEVMITPEKKYTKMFMNTMTINDMTFDSWDSFENFMMTYSGPAQGIDGFVESLGYGGARTDREGRARFKRLSPGKYTVSVSHPGYAVSTAEIELPAHEETVVWMERCGTLEGRVLFDARRHRPPFTLYLDARGEGINPEAWMPRLALTDADGHFRVKGLNSGKWLVYVNERFLNKRPLELLTAMRQEPLGEGEARITPGEKTGLEIRLGGLEFMPSAGLSGVVLLDGLPAEGALVECYAGSEEKASSLDDKGRFHFEEIPEGRADLAIFIPRGPDGEPAFVMGREIQVQPGMAMEENFAVYTGALFGRVSSYPEGLPAAGVEIKAWGPFDGTVLEGNAGPWDAEGIDCPDEPQYLYGLSSPVEIKMLTSPDGSFRCSRLPAGLYKVKARALEDDSSLRRATDTRIKEVLAAGAAGPVNLTLFQHVSIKGRIELPEKEDLKSGLMLMFYSSEDPFEGVNTVVRLGMEGNPNTMVMNITGSTWVQVDQDTATFEIPKILPGAYFVRLMPADSALSFSDILNMDVYKPVPVDVPPQGLTDLVLTLEKEEQPLHEE
ncbi:MAG: sigma-70 family RNA polymerase sigma factor [Planctomycetota bacterium]|jgi:RNA polymerase sigma-70 factor (ECF subfamily)